MKRIKITEDEKAMVMYNFSLSMKNIIKLTGYSQNRLAKVIGVDKSNFSKMINRERLFAKLDLLRILLFLEVTSNIMIKLFDYNGTTIKTSDKEDIMIREFIYDDNIKTVDDLNKAIINKKSVVKKY